MTKKKVGSAKTTRKMMEPLRPKKKVLIKKMRTKKTKLMFLSELRKI